MRTDGQAFCEPVYKVAGAKVVYGNRRFIIVLTTHQANQRQTVHLIILFYGMEVHLHSFLTLALDVSERSDSPYGRFKQWGTNPGTY